MYVYFTLKVQVFVFEEQGDKNTPGSSTRSFGHRLSLGGEVKNTRDIDLRPTKRR